MGRQVQISETEDDTVTIWHRGSVLPARAFEKEVHSQQGAMFDNKLLARALEFAKQQQQIYDDKKMKAPSMIERDKRLLRERKDRGNTAPA